MGYPLRLCPFRSPPRALTIGRLGQVAFVTTHYERVRDVLLDFLDIVVVLQDSTETSSVADGVDEKETIARINQIILPQISTFLVSTRVYRGAVPSTLLPSSGPAGLVLFDPHRSLLACDRM